MWMGEGKKAEARGKNGKKNTRNQNQGIIGWKGEKNGETHWNETEEQNKQV